MKAKTVVFTDYKGITVFEMQELRKHIADGGKYRVVKNTLAKLASAETPVEVAKEHFTGPVGLAIGYDDPLLIVKRVVEFSKKNKKLKVGVGVVEGRLCSAQDVMAMSALPSRQELLGIMAGLFQAPATRLAGGLAATISGFANALKALKDKKEQAGA